MFVPSEAAQEKETNNNYKINNADPPWKRGLIAVIILFCVGIVMGIGFLPDTLEVGQVSPRSFYAPREVVDRYVTQQRKEAAAEEVPRVYELDTGAVERAEDNLIETFQLLISYNENFLETQERIEQEENVSDWDEAEHKETLRNRFIHEAPLDLGSDSEETVVPIGKIENNMILEESQTEAAAFLVETMEQGVEPGGMGEVENQITAYVEERGYSEAVKNFVEAVLVSSINPNLIYNEEATEERREEAMEEVEPATVVQGEVIVREGERLTERHLMILEDLGLQRAHGDYYMFLGLIALIGASFVLTGFYLYFYYPETFNSSSLIVLLGLIFVATLIFARLMDVFSGYLVPVAMAAILITVLYGARLAILIVSMLSIFIGILAGNDLMLAIFALTSGFAGTFSVAKLQERKDLTKSGFYVAAANAAIIFALFLIAGNFQLESEALIGLSRNVVFGIFNGFLSAILAIGFLPYLETAFGLTTSVRLLELANPNQPLLKRLLMEAPGTYHHSIVVANMAETAAEEIGANSILARVGAYYHDVGKLVRPYFFIENQFASDNPHDKISPNLSSLIITSHVKDGMELAQKYGLPRAIADIIQEHHGTKKVNYFYHKACDNNKGDENVAEEDFKYEGPKPQSRESAIILLADAVEASARTLEAPNRDKIDKMVRKMVKEHLNEGQLDECHLTMKDLKVIADAFVQILAGIFHQRIEYPDNLLDERGRGDEFDDYEQNRASADNGDGKKPE